MNLDQTTLGHLLAHHNETVRRHAQGALKALMDYEADEKKDRNTYFQTVRHSFAQSDDPAVCVRCTIANIICHQCGKCVNCHQKAGNPV